jgi:hypothetical protein
MKLLIANAELNDVNILTGVTYNTADQLMSDQDIRHPELLRHCIKLLSDEVKDGGF